MNSIITDLGPGIMGIKDMKEGFNFGASELFLFAYSRDGKTSAPYVPIEDFNLACRYLKSALLHIKELEARVDGDCVHLTGSARLL